MLLHDNSWISLKEAALTLPGAPHWSTLRRWSLIGLDGIKLRVIRVGWRLFTTPDALEEFCEQVTEASGSGIATPDEI